MKYEPLALKKKLPELRGGKEKKKKFKCFRYQSQRPLDIVITEIVYKVSTFSRHLDIKNFLGDKTTLETMIFIFLENIQD